MVFIFLVFFVKHMFINSTLTHEGFTMSVKYLSLKCLSKIIAFHISSRLIDSTDVSGFESVSYIKVSNIDVFGAFTAGFPSISF